MTRNITNVCREIFGSMFFIHFHNDQYENLKLQNTTHFGAASTESRPLLPFDCNSSKFVENHDCGHCGLLSCSQRITSSICVFVVYGLISIHLYVTCYRIQNFVAGNARFRSELLSRTAATIATVMPLSVTYSSLFNWL